MFKSLSPNLMVHNVRESLAFYQQLGFIAVEEVPLPEEENNGELAFAILVNGTISLMLQAEASLKEDVTALVAQQVGQAAMTLHFAVENAPELYQQLQGKAEVVKPLHRTWYGMDEFYIQDNNGYVLGFGSHADTN
jgi:lactoylglutathione lyase